MTKTQQAIEALNKTQKAAIKFVGTDRSPRKKPQRIDAGRKGWFRTGAACRKDTAQVLCNLGLVQIDQLDGHCIVKPTALGKRVAGAL